jgi:hypothetical protein
VSLAARRRRASAARRYTLPSAMAACLTSATGSLARSSSPAQLAISIYR